MNKVAAVSARTLRKALFVYAGRKLSHQQLEMASALASKALSNPAVQKAVKGKVGAATESLE